MSCPYRGNVVSGIRFSPRPNRANEINWHEWDEAAFEKAQAEDKPILLSISAVWCHWCHVMDETSYSDSDVISLINENFVPVRVDNDQRPDINSRYNMGGWPSTAFLTPYGDVVTGATYMAPKQFKGALQQVSGSYHKQRDALLRQAEEIRGKRESKAALAMAGQEVDTSMVDIVSRAVVEAYDSLHGGFGNQPKFPMAPAVELLLNMYQSTGDASYRLMVEMTLDNMMNGGLYDHEEDGFFRYSTTRDWSIPHYEKMLEDNVGLLSLYLHSYLVTGNEAYASVASQTVDYLSGHLYDGTSGAFYGSQDADEEYYSHPIAERQKLRPPEVDPVFYTSINASVASAYLEAAWVLNRPNLADVGLKTVDYLLKRCAESSLCRSYSSDGEAGIPALLTDYAHLVIALMDAYDRASSPLYLDEAKRLAGEMRDIFWDKHGGGFFDVPGDPQALGTLKVRDKPISDNIPAVEALIRLFNSTLDEEYRETARTALSAFVPVYQEYREAAAGYALAVHRFIYSPVEVTVVGAPGDAGTRAMITAAANIPYAHTAIKYMDSSDEERLAEAGYWPGREAQAYVCLETLCLAPVNDPETLHQTVLEFLESRAQGTGSIIQTIGNL
jgi:uncharacterized protein YyaL (SSP411 family)